MYASDFALNRGFAIRSLVAALLAALCAFGITAGAQHVFDRSLDDIPLVDGAAGVDPRLEGRIVAVKGHLDTQDTTVTDSAFLRPNGYVLLVRFVRRWSEWTDSDGAHQGEWRQVTSDDRWAAGAWTAMDGHVGAYDLDPRDITWWWGRPLDIKPPERRDSDRAGMNEARLVSEGWGQFYVGHGNHNEPATNDLEVEFMAIAGGDEVTVLGKQKGRSIVRFAGRGGKATLLVTSDRSPEALVSEVRRDGADFWPFGAMVLGSWAGLVLFGACALSGFAIGLKAVGATLVSAGFAVVISFFTNGFRETLAVVLWFLVPLALGTAATLVGFATTNASAPFLLAALVFAVFASIRYRLGWGEPAFEDPVE
jgi:hypothetical protein